MRAVGEIGEPIVGGDAVAVTAKEAFGCLSHESEMFVFSKRDHRRIRAAADCLRCLTARAIELAIVEIVITKPAARIDPHEPRPWRHCAPRR